MADDDVVRMRATVVNDEALASIRAVGRELGLLQQKSGEGAKKAKADWMGFSGSFKEVKSSILEVAPALAGLGLGAASAGAAVGELLKTFNEVGERIVKLKYQSQELGLAENVIRGFNVEAAKAGIAPEAMGAALARFKRNMEDFSYHVGAARESLIALGAGPVVARMEAASTSAGKLKEAYDFKEILNQLDPSGARGRRFFEELGLGADLARLSWEKLAKSQRISITPQQQKDAENFRDTVIELGAAWDGFELALATASFPAITGLLSQLTDIIAAMNWVAAHTPKGTGRAVGEAITHAIPGATAWSMAARLGRWARGGQEGTAGETPEQAAPGVPVGAPTRGTAGPAMTPAQIRQRMAGGGGGGVRADLTRHAFMSFGGTPAAALPGVLAPPSLPEGISPARAAQSGIDISQSVRIVKEGVFEGLLDFWTYLDATKQSGGLFGGAGGAGAGAGAAGGGGGSGGGGATGTTTGDGTAPASVTPGTGPSVGPEDLASAEKGSGPGGAYTLGDIQKGLADRPQAPIETLERMQKGGGAGGAYTLGDIATATGGGAAASVTPTGGGGGGRFADPGMLKAAGRSGKLNEDALYKTLYNNVPSNLVGYVPPDGARFGIKTGSREEWAKLQYKLGQQESGGSVAPGPEAGHSGTAGLYQFEASDLARHGQAGKAVTDPMAQIGAMNDVFRKIPTGSGTIMDRKTGGAAYFGPLRDVGVNRGVIAKHEAEAERVAARNRADTQTASVTPQSAPAVTPQAPPASVTPQAGVKRELAPSGEEPKAFIFHHTAGGGTAKSVVEGWRNDPDPKRRGVGTQYIMDRDGIVHNVKEEFGYQGRGHFLHSVVPGVSNRTAVGMEIIAKNDADMTEKQVEASRKFYEQYYPKALPLGHSEVSPGDRTNEGVRVVRAVKAARAAGTSQVAAVAPPAAQVPADYNYTPGAMSPEMAAKVAQNTVAMPAVAAAAAAAAAKVPPTSAQTAALRLPSIPAPGAYAMKPPGPLHGGGGYMAEAHQGAFPTETTEERYNRERTARLAAEAAPTQRIDEATGPQQVKAEGTVNVHVHGPNGTKVAANSDGMFQKTSLRRHIQMQPTEAPAGAVGGIGHA